MWLFTALVWIAYIADTLGSPLYSQADDSIYILPQIVGGELASLGEIPYQVSLSEDGEHLCGGVVLTDVWILTAAHCVQRYENKPSDLLVRAGLTNIVNPGPTMQSSVVIKVIAHDGFDENLGLFGGNDIGLLKLATSLKFNQYVAPISLPPRNYLASGTSLVSGWGALQENGPFPNDLYKVNMPILTLKQCEDLYGDDVTEQFICGYQDNKDACEGDSGGPMTCEGGSVVCGIVSAGVGCARPDEAGVYTNVSYYLDWLADNMKTA